jgi:2-polyprenyl-6-methoxyphenol hydroxylase-like FAD-dependent oxidoreductase
MAEAPVLVVGAGPVGLAAALLLARFGVPVVVLESAPARQSVGSRSICVQRDVLDIYHRIGCATALMAQGVTWHRGRTFYREHELFTITFPDAGRSAYPGFINIGQSSVEQELAQVAAAQPLIDLRYGHRVWALSQDDGGVAVRAATEGGDVQVAGTHLIGADGPHSTVRLLLGLDFAGHSFDDRFLIADIRAELPFGAERRFHFDPQWNPGRQVLVHPQPDSVWRIDWQVPADYDLAADRDSGKLDARIRKVTGGCAYQVVWLSVYRFQQRLADRMQVGRVLLAGDAAHLMAPFGARGLNSGVQDAENAAWKIAYQRRGWAGPALLPSYQAERHAAALENLRVTGETMRFLVPQDDAQRAWRREVLDRAVTEESARSLVNSGKLAEPYWYLDSPLSTGNPPADFPTEPGLARPAVPGVLCPDGPVSASGVSVPGVAAPGASRLRELFGLVPTVLTLDWDPGPTREPDEPGYRWFRLDRIDGAGVLAPALAAAPGWCAVVRPDGHLAAVLHRPGRSELAGALRTARGLG